MWLDEKGLVYGWMIRVFLGLDGTRVFFFYDQGLVYGWTIRDNSINRNYVRTIRFAFSAVADIVTSITIHQICMPTVDNAALALGKSDAYKMVRSGYTNTGNLVAHRFWKICLPLFKVKHT